MSGTLTIAWKDFKSLVNSPLFFFLAGACCAIWSINFLNLLGDFAQRQMFGAESSIHFTVFLSHLSTVNIILLFAIPALTMKLLAEEKKMRTYDLLLTAPITATDIVMGKFLAGYGAALLLLTISFLYPLATSLVSDFHFGPLLTSYFGLSLLLAIYVSVGLFSSSLTQSVMFSVILGVIFILGLWFMSQGINVSDNPTVQTLMQHISLGEQFSGFIRGSLRVSSVVFFVSTAVLFVFLTQRVVESSRWR